MSKSKSDRVDTRALILKAANHAPKAPEAEGVLPDVPELADDCPTLNAYLTVLEVDGKPRKTATITWWVEECGVKGVFSDRQHKRKLWVSAPSLIEFLKALEERLTAPVVDWRSDAGTKWRGVK